MSDKKLSRRDMLKLAGSATLATAFPSPGLTARAESPQIKAEEAAEVKTEATAEEVVNALEGAYGVHPGRRRNHTKGIGAEGFFIGNPELAAYSRSGLFTGEKITVVARFSIAGGNPNVPDADRGPRGLGLEFRLPSGSLHHMTMINTPMFFAAVPKTFLDKFLALAIDPATGKPNPAKLEAFAKSHADNKGQAEYLKAHNPPPSYANCPFFGIHTFKFVNAKDEVTPVKFRFVPGDGEKFLTDAEMASAPNDFLEKALFERLAEGPAKWDMIVTIGEPTDEQTNPTVLWPEGRKEVKAGTLTITSAVPNAEAGSFKINYDPLVMADGIQPTNDPVLLFRSPSYATSFTRRLRGI